MAKEILQLNIASTSTVTYDPTIYAPYSDYDYNRDFKRYRDDIILENDDYYISHNGEYTHSDIANDVIVNGIVIWGNPNHSYAEIIKTVVDLGTKKIYIPPRKIDNVYVEQNPVSRITFTNTARSIQPYFDGVAYGSWVETNPFATIADVSVELHPLYHDTRTFYSAAMLQYKAQWEYSQYPTFAAALNSMQYGAMAINPGAIFTRRQPGISPWYSCNCFADYEYIENLWLIPFVSDDEYHAAYAVYYQWDDSDIAIINEYG